MAFHIYLINNLPRRCLANNFSLLGGTDVIVGCGADLKRLQQLIPDNIDEYKVINFLSVIVFPFDN